MILRYAAFLLIGLFPCTLSAQSEQEPNDDTATANAMAFGTAITGTWCSGDGADVFSFTTSADGYLQMGFDVSHADAQVNVTLEVRLLDANGTDVDGASTTSGPGGVVLQNPFTLFCVAQGTYYIQVSGSANNECNDYSLTAALVQPPFGNDNEPNNTSTQAQVLADGVYAEGHVNYSYGGDLTDWFRFELPGDGRVDLDLDAFNQNAGTYYCTLDLLDASLNSVGTFNTLVGAIFSADTALNHSTQFCLSQGTYYLHVTDVQGCGMSYRLRWNHGPALALNDAEENDTQAQAIAVFEGLQEEGHLNFDTGGDNADWYSFTVPVATAPNIQYAATHQNGGTYPGSIEWFNSGGTAIGTSNCIVYGGSVFTPSDYSPGLLVPGTYGFRLTSTVCGTSYRFTMSGVGAVGISETTGGTITICAVPNPSADGFFTLRSTFPATRLQLSDIGGRLLRDERVGPANGSIPLDASSLPPGIYLARLTDGEGLWLQVPLIRTR